MIERFIGTAWSLFSAPFPLALLVIIVIACYAVAYVERRSN